MIKRNSNKLSRRKTESMMSAREKLLQLAGADTVALEDILAACINVMSEDNCESVICELAEQVLFGNNMPDAVGVEDVMPADDELIDPDEVDELPEDEELEDDDVQELDLTKDEPEEEEVIEAESFSRRRQLERRIRNIEKMINRR